jgi:hypothetical protein
MTDVSDAGDYPETTVKPELFMPKDGPGADLPVGEVVEWFDFGQFVELFATDDSGKSHPLVVTQDDAILQASLRIRDEMGTPTRTVDLVGGVPLSRAVTGEGSEAFKAIGVPDQVAVDDVDELIRSGEIAANGKTYHLTLHGRQIDAIRDGESQLLRARAEQNGSSGRVWVQLLPKVLDAPILTAEALNGLLADPVIAVGTADGEKVRLAFEPSEVRALLASQTVVVRGTVGNGNGNGQGNGKGNGNGTRLVRLRQQELLDVGYAAAPKDDWYAFPDLSAFLASPTVPGVDGLPFRVPLTGAIVQELRTAGSAQVTLTGGRVLALRVEATQP